jgi:hypothetical protein
MQVYDSKELFDILCSETFKLVSIKSPDANNITIINFMKFIFY